MKSENDDGDDVASSRYSSCGESEFERYCSANSAMGTPSVCSSITVFNDFSELEFGGNSRSFGVEFGDEGSGLENFSLGGEKIGRNREEMKRLSDTTSVNYGSSGFEMYGNESDEIGFSVLDNGLMSKVESESLPLKVVSEIDNDDGSGKGDCSEDDDGDVLGKRSGFEWISNQGVKSSGPIDAREDHGSDRIVKELTGQDDGASSRDEHSEGEDSIYSYGSDDDNKKVEFRSYRKNGHHMETKMKDENPLLINSSVAFGSDDWDDFEQESGGFAVPLDSSPARVSENRKETSSEAKGEVSDSTAVNSGKSVIDIPVSSQDEDYDELDDLVDRSLAPASFLDFDVPPEVEDVKDIPVESCQVQGGNDVIEITKSSFTTPVIEKVNELQKEDVIQIQYTKNHVRGGDGSADCPKTYSLDSVCDIAVDSIAEEYKEKIDFHSMNEYGSMAQLNQNTSTKETVNKDDQISETQVIALRDCIEDSSTDPISSRSTASYRNIKFHLLEDSRQKAESSTLRNKMKKNPPVSDDHDRENPTPVKTEAHELNEFYDEVVLEMEEILLASNESPGARFPYGNKPLQSHLSAPIRDGGSSASTSGTDDAYPHVHQPLRIDGVEVVGARQKQGDVSFGERLVGVKEHTVYKLRVWSGNDQWEVERRYRDFSTLYRRLKTLSTSQGWVLPSPWATVEKESRKIFGNVSPDVVSERSILIQECLDSILHPRFFTTFPSSLVWFLCPRDSVPSSPASNETVSQSVSHRNRENVSTFGKTISLVVEIQPYKSVKQMLEAQHYTCAGCYKHFDDGKTLIGEFAQTFGWGKPRICEYTSQLFCTSCHTNETAVLPARVLHNWDFTQYPVSQLAKSYLDSIHDQPMLCVSAVNPFLFSKVPTLLHVMSVRRKIGSILAYVRCSFRGSINRGLGSRRYLLQSNDFFALRDLIDLSKGAFAVLPIVAETVLKKIVEHITEQCLVCCDVGVPCGARQACNDPSSLIFPFQEVDIEKCPSCESEFHKVCFRKLADCHCGARLRVDNQMGLIKRLTRGVGSESSGAFDFLGKGLGSGPSVGFLSGLFAKGKHESLEEHKGSDNVILMGSLPSTGM